MNIDIHAHILPGLDDGPETLAESLAMAQACVKAGYATVIATPHVIPGLYDNTRGAILAAVRQLQAELDAGGIPLRVLPGAEYHLSPDLPHLVATGELLTLNDTGKYLLVELPLQEVPAYAPQVLFDLLVSGITPVIAHPERNDYLVRHPGALAEMVRNGILAQVTAASLTGLFGGETRRAAARFIKDGTAHFVATDAHGPGRRLEAGPQAARLFPAQSTALFHDHPAAVICGTALPCPAHQKPPEHCRFTLFGRKK